jgi:hypothetical protein
MSKNKPSWFLGAASVAIAMLLVNTNAAPMPWTPLKTITSIGLVHMLVKADPTVKRAK